ncbi:hypothetical protein BDW67DRAFT_185522 [Aspergillus spinulosporus]
MAITAQHPQAYTIQRVFSLQPDLSTRSLKAAWARLVEALPILRTRIIPSVQSDALQVVVRDQQPIWQESASLEDYLAADKATPITYGGVLSCTAIVESEDRMTWFFVWTAHHSIYDGWSMAKMMEMLVQLLQGEAVSAPVPVSRFIAYLSQQDSQETATFWKNHLEGANWARFPALPSLHHKVLPQNLLKHHIGIPWTVGAITTPTLLRAAWALLVAAHIGSDEAIINVVLSGRMANIDGITDIIAPTITSVPFCENTTQMIPFEHTGLQNIRRLVPSLGPEFDPGHMFVVQLAEETELLPTMYNKLFKRELTTADAFYTHPLNIECTVDQGNSGVGVEMQFNQEIISIDAAQRLLAQFAHIVQQLADNSEAELLLREIQVLSVEDAIQLSQWNSSIPPKVDRCIHELVQDQIAAQPAALAISAWDGEMTYDELDLASHQLAQHLVDSGVGPEVMVGLCMDKSKLAVVAMLAVLRAGGAVVPLGVQHPLAYIEGILKDTAAPIVLVDRGHEQRLAALSSHTQLLPVDRFFDTAVLTMAKTSTEPLTAVQPENVAWVIYTSGSTGTPKGVVLEHGAIATSLLAHGRAFDIQPHDRLSQFAAYTFDVSIQEVITTLSFGACICIPSEDDHVNRLTPFLSEANVSIITFTSTVAALVQPQDVPSVRTLVLMGEAVQPKVIDQWAGHATVINAYGPSECCIHTTGNKIRHRSEALNVGKALAGVFWVVNPANVGQLVPIGAPGELLIEGPQLARGYLNDPVKTAAAFIKDPAFTEQLGLSPIRRIYRTGDLVQQNADGSLTYIGRRDTQVKIRGQRVEVGEIETQIVRLLPESRKAIVDVIWPAGEAHDSILMLVAIVKYPEAGPALSCCRALNLYNPTMITDATRKALEKLYIDLAKVLPSYMVPSAFLLAPNIPINMSGKLDRRTVREEMCRMSRELLRSYSCSTVTKQAPKTAMEHRLQSLWAEALSLSPDAIGVNDSFFRLGGDSVVAMKLAAAARAQNIPLLVADVFTLPRIQDMAAALEEHHESNGHVEADPLLFSLWPELAQTNNTDTEQDHLLADIAAQCGISPDQIEDIYPCTPLQSGLMAITAQHPRAYVIQRVFQLHASLSTKRLKAAWNQLVEVLPILRTRIVPSIQADALQVVVQEQPVWYHGSSLEDYLALDRANAITYGGELSRTAIIESSDNGNRTFVWTSHHSIYDGWSKSKMINMLGQLLRGEALLFTPVPVSRFIAYLARQDEERKVAFWKKHLQGVNGTSYPALPSLKHKVNPCNKLSCRLDISLVPGAATMSTVLRAAWALLVAVNTGSEEAVINVVLSGRMAAVDGIADLVAPTITSVPFREQATEMIPYEHTGLQNIRRMAPDLGPDFDPGHIFLVQPAGESESARPMFDIGMDVHDEATSMDAFDVYVLNVKCTVDGANEVTVELSFDREVVPVNAAQRLLAQFSHIAEQLTRHADVELPLRALRLLPEEDIAQLKQWNSVVHPRIERCLHDLLRENMLRRPSAVAISAWDGELTYGELEDFSRRLACHLADRGIGPEVMVGLCMGKSKWAVVAMLAILRAGGAVVPLGQSRLSSVLPVTITVNAILYESLPVTAYDACTTVTADNMAWVLYTSGSSGQPKGVVLEHGALATSVLANARFLSLTTKTRTLQFAAFTFNVCITDIFCTLARGGCVCLMSEDDRINDLPGCFQKANANYVELTPTALKLLSPDQVPTLKKLALGGEQIKLQLVNKWSNSVQIINLYGPSECAVVSAAKIVRAAKDARNFGKPLAGAFWVVYPGNYNCLCPTGVRGELLIEGPLLARGYLNDPDMTAAAFIRDPAFVQELGLSPGRRMYRTGDIVEQNADGSLSYVGRIDTQVKIRGQRVEIGEIENQINFLLSHGHEAMVDVVCPAGEAVDALPILIAVIKYIKAGPALTSLGLLKLYDGAQITEAARKSVEKLEANLGQMLPAYMVPSMFLLALSIPVNASGKLNHRAVRDQLRLMSRESLSSFSCLAGSKQAPTTAMEQRLQSLWATALILDPKTVGVNDSFFRLGGDSVVAMKLTAAARAEKIPLSVADIFQWPRLADIAAVMEEKQVKDNGLADEDPAPLSLWPELAHINDSEAERDVYPCTPLQAGLMAITAQHPEAYIVQRVFRLEADLPIEKLKAAWTRLVEALPILRTRIIPSTYADALQVVYLEADKNTPIMYGGALSRVAVLENGDCRYFVWTAHHSVFDGWSLIEMSKWDKEQAAAFWQQQLEGANWAQYPALPCLQHVVNPSDVIQQHVEIPNSPSDATVATLLRAAWGLLVAANTGSDESVISIVLSGRMAAVEGITNLVAPTVTSVPFRVAASPTQSVREFLASIHKRATEMIPYEHTGLQNIRRMVSSLGPEFDPGHSFVVQPAEERQLQVLSRDDSMQLSWWNSTVPPTVERCIHDMVLDKMIDQPCAVAISGWDREMTYKELDDLSRRLGYHLVEQGVGPEVMVGVCMDKSKFGVVAMLAILRAGGAVVPLNVLHPLARIDGIVKDTATRLILVDHGQEQRLASLASLAEHTQLLAVDSFFCVATSTPTPSAEPCMSVQPENVAWVIYTSGSTGMPKGVVLEHRALATSILAHGHAFGIQADDRLSQFAAYTFDVAIQEIMTTLTFGACICIPSEDDRVNRLTPFLADTNVTIATLTSTVASLVQPENTPSIRTLVLMECCIHTTGNRVQNRSEAPNIGKPLASLFWVVNPSSVGQLVPIGVPGELLIEGPQLARGYLNDPVKTAAAFINDPAFTKHLGLTGRRMYRTGDLVQQNADGSVIYLGRHDTQVKIRGQRVEIGEIESQISRLLPDASGAIVDVVQPAGEAHDGVLTLVAIIEYPEVGVSSSGDLDLYKHSLITDAARNGLQGLDIKLGQVLPAYMVPSAYLLTPKIPVNNSGKLDRQFVRKQLRQMSRDVLSSFSHSIMAKQAPNTAMEQRLHSLWAAALLLSTDAVGINDSFFRLGGDSVVAMKLTAAARAEQIPLSVADIFRWPRLVNLAEAMEKKNEDYGFADKDPAPFSLWPELAQIDPEMDDERERLLADVAMQCAVTTDLIEDIYPCSPLQAGLMAITAQRPSAYVIQRVFRLQAKLSIQQLKAAWTPLAKNLPILRTHIISSVVCDALQVVLRKEPVWHHGTLLDDYLATDRATPITYGGALNCTAIVHDGADRYFVWTTHHSVYDGWSVNKMMELLAQLLQGAPLPAPVPVSRFIAYLALQNEEKTALFWQKHLKGANWARYPALPTPQHHVNPRDTLQQHLHVPLKSEAATLPIVLRAAWALLVATNTGLNEAVINVVLSGCMAPINGITDLIAPTVTTVPFFVSAPQEQSNIRRMVPGLGPEFDPGHIFVVQPAGEAESGTLKFDMGMDVDEKATSMDAFDAYPLTVECTVRSDVGDVAVELRYDRDVVPVGAAQRLVAQFSRIVQQLSDNVYTEQPLGQLQLLPLEDSMQLSNWNSTVPPRVERCIHDLVFDEMVAHPERTAISAWDSEMTYGELDEASRCLAHYLSATYCVGPEVIVGICMDKSRLAVVALLAILRAGGAVIPLGVHHPLLRIQGIVQDTDAPLVLVDRMHEQRLDALSGYTQLLAVDSFFDTAPLSPIPSTKPCVSVQPSNVAWVIYTSGSTGTPKGVVLEHGALATSILAHGRAFDIQPHDRLSQFAAYTFDVAIQEIMTTLCLGACICVPSEDDRINRLTPFLSEAGITIATLTSTVAALVQPQHIPTIRTLVLMGEAVQPKVIDQWIKHANIINAYGPSECCIHTTGNRILNRAAAPNIGKPLAARFWVVNPASIQLVPIGAPGELLIEGPQLARGYLNNPEKTAAAFIKDPAFVKELGLSPGRRMYRTGDLVQQNPDGSLTYLGRRDTQVKIRGQRVEIGEIKGQIVRLMPNAHEAIVDLVRPAGEPHDGILILVAVIEYPDLGPSSSGELELYDPVKTTEPLRKALKKLDTDLGQVLPAYMVPTVFLLTPKIPVNTSGKLDRRAVREQLCLMSRQALTSFANMTIMKQAPTTAMEERLQSLWATALALEPEAVGINNSFFRLGGDSVVAMKLTAAARDENIPLFVADIFRWPRLADMAAAIEERDGLDNGHANSKDPAPLSLWPELAQAADAGAETQLLADVAAQCSVSVDQIEDVYPCSPLQAGLMAITAQQPEAYVIQQIFRLQSSLSTEQLKAAWTKLAESLPILRTRIIPSVQANALQVVVRSQPVWQDSRSLEDYLALDKATPITYGGALSHTAIVEDEDGTNQFFVWTTHHSIYNGWSVVKTMELLAQLLKGEALPATVPVSQFIGYLALQKKDDIATF